MEDTRAIEMKTIRTTTRMRRGAEQNEWLSHRIRMNENVVQSKLSPESSLLVPISDDVLIPAFKIQVDTKCVKAKMNTNKIRNTSIILRKGELYWGNIIVRKKRIYIDITECYKHKTKQNSSLGISIYIPVIFDITGKYMINVCENGLMLTDTNYHILA
jgi:hypothetical protein